MFIFVCYKSKNFSSIDKTPKSHKWLKRSATRFMWSKIMLMWSKKIAEPCPYARRQRPSSTPDTQIRCGNARCERGRTSYINTSRRSDCYSVVINVKVNLTCHHRIVAMDKVVYHKFKRYLIHNNSSSVLKF